MRIVSNTTPHIAAGIVRQCATNAAEKAVSPKVDSAVSQVAKATIGGWFSNKCANAGFLYATATSNIGILVGGFAGGFVGLSKAQEDARKGTDDPVIWGIKSVAVVGCLGLSGAFAGGLVGPFVLPVALGTAYLASQNPESPLQLSKVTEQVKGFYDALPSVNLFGEGKEEDVSVQGDSALPETSVPSNNGYTDAPKSSEES